MVVGLSFNKEVREKDDVCEGKGSVCRFQMTDKFAEDNVEKESGFMTNSECIIQELREWWCNQDSSRTEANHTRFVLAVQKGLKNETDSAKAIGVIEIGVKCARA